MRRLRTLSTRRLATLAAIVVAVAVSGGIAQAALLGGADPKPAPKALDRAVADALGAKPVDGISARVRFTNGLLPSGSLPSGSASPLAAGASGRLWLAADGRLRIELQSDQSGDTQIVVDGRRVTIYDASSNTAYTGTLPQDAADHAGTTPDAHQPPTLAQIDKALNHLARTWTISGATPTSTAGQPTYTVRITPKDSGGLLGAAELAWDARRGVPLRAAVYASGQSSPVLELTATSVSYGPVAASDLRAAVPPDAKVVDLSPDEGHAPRAGKRDATGTESGAHADESDATGAESRERATASGARTHERGLADARPSTADDVAAVRRALDFPLAAPAQISGLRRSAVRLIRSGDETGALVVYGKGFGSVLVLEYQAQNAPGKHESDPLGAMRLPQVNVDGATGSELATALGTILTFERAGVTYTVAGLVPPVAAENVARGLS